MAYRNVEGTVLFRLKLSQLFGFMNLLKSCFGRLQFDQMMLAVGRWGGT
jgi:NADH:ubiquinone oxidoreductase subunit H